MRRVAVVFIAAFLLSYDLQASEQISISTPRPVILLIAGGRIHVPLFIKIENHRDNRWLRLDWEWGASVKQLNNPGNKEMDGSKEYALDRKEDEYLIFTDEDFCQSTSGANGLILPVGEYRITATLIRNVEGKEKKYPASITVTIGTKDDGGIQE